MSRLRRSPVVIGSAPPGLRATCHSGGASMVTRRRSWSATWAETSLRPFCSCVCSALPLRPRSSKVARGVASCFCARSICAISSSPRCTRAGDRSGSAIVACQAARRRARSAASSDMALVVRARSARVCVTARSFSSQCRSRDSRRCTESSDSSPVWVSSVSCCSAAAWRVKLCSKPCTLAAARVRRCSTWMNFSSVSARAGTSAGAIVAARCSSVMAAPSAAAGAWAQPGVAKAQAMHSNIHAARADRRKACSVSPTNGSRHGRARHGQRPVVRRGGGGALRDAGKGRNLFRTGSSVAPSAAPWPARR